MHYTIKFQSLSSVCSVPSVCNCLCNISLYNFFSFDMYFLLFFATWLLTSSSICLKRMIINNIHYPHSLLLTSFNSLYISNKLFNVSLSEGGSKNSNILEYPTLNAHLGSFLISSHMDIDKFVWIWLHYNKISCIIVKHVCIMVHHTCGEVRHKAIVNRMTSTYTSFNGLPGGALTNALTVGKTAFSNWLLFSGRVASACSVNPMVCFNFCRSSSIKKYICNYPSYLYQKM